MCDKFLGVVVVVSVFNVRIDFMVYVNRCMVRVVLKCICIFNEVN